VDILEAVGVDVDCDAATVERSIGAAGIGIFNGMSPAVHPGGLGRILSQIRFGSTLNIAASLANPVHPTHGVRGVYADGLLGPVGDVMMEIGYEHAMVVHGYDDRREAGMDELSVLGESVVSELHADGWRDSYTVEPEDLGLRRAVHSEIAPLGDLRSEAVRFIRVLGGRGHEACGDAACLNAAAVLYVAGRATDLGDGLAQAREAVESGAALLKLEEWVAAQAGGVHQRAAGEARLSKLRVEAGVPA
jgi:anthranilate phosphoribosyltransferase